MGTHVSVVPKTSSFQAEVGLRSLLLTQSLKELNVNVWRGRKKRNNLHTSTNNKWKWYCWRNWCCSCFEKANTWCNYHVCLFLSKCVATCEHQIKMDYIPFKQWTRNIQMSKSCCVLHFVRTTASMKRQHCRQLWHCHWLKIDSCLTITSLSPTPPLPHDCCPSLALRVLCQ